MGKRWSATGAYLLVAMLLAACSSPHAAVPPKDTSAQKADTQNDTAILDTQAADAPADAPAANDAAGEIAAELGEWTSDVAADASETADAAESDSALPDAPFASEISSPSCDLAEACTALGSPGVCQKWACEQGHCVASHSPAGTPCATSGSCLTWTCDGAGSCNQAQVGVCPGATCKTGLCDLQSGACSLVASPASAPCDDGNPCSAGDHCSGDGSCLPGAIKSCPQSPCNTASCDPASGDCAAVPLASGATCSDGNPCTTGDTCDGLGACAGGVQLQCPVTLCHLSSCDPLSGACSSVPADGAFCDDDNVCTVGDACASGQCQPGEWLCPCQFDDDCADNNPCTLDTCPQGSCVHLPLAATPCSDGDGCSLGDHCSGGQCSAAGLLSCDDGNACTADGCNPSTGKCFSAALSELACSDGNACTLGDACSSGACAPGSAKVCADQSECVASTCDPLSGSCDPVALAGPCTGSDACTLGKTCLGGQCQGGLPLDCDDTNPCTTDSCDPATGACSHLPAAMPTPCGPAHACVKDVCTCALGEFALPSPGQEWLRAVAATPTGFVAVGESNSPQGQRGLLLVVDLANQLTLVRRIGGTPPVALAAALGDSGGTRAVATVGGSEVDLLQLDPLGNLAGQTKLLESAEAQALLALPDGGVLVLASEPWAPGTATHLLRVAPTGAVQWAQTLPPGLPSQVARAYTLSLLGTSVLVAGQDHAFADPSQTSPWLLQVALGTGQLLAAPALPTLPAGALILASDVAGGQLWLAGGLLGPDAAAAGSWLARVPVADLPAAATLVEVATGARAWRGLAAQANGVVAVGWQVNKDLDAAAQRRTGTELAWQQTWPKPGKQMLSAVVQLLDGTLVAVGSRDTATGSEAVWLRLAADGTTTCL